MINNNRQTGRRRGRGGQQQRTQGNSGVRDNGNRIDNRSRGNAAQLLEKYKSLARDAQQAGDRVNTEYFLQFADHYFRVLAETRSRFEENRTPMQGGANTFQDDEQDYNDEGEPVARAEQPRQPQDGNRSDGNRQDSGRQESARQEGARQNGQQSYQGDRQANGQDRPDRADRFERQDRPERQDRQANRGERSNVDDRPRGYEGERQSPADRGPRPNPVRAERYQEVEQPVREDAALPVHPDMDQPAPIAAASQEQAPVPAEAPRRRGRPRREPIADAPEAFEADRLPPSLMIPAADAGSESVPATDTTDAEPEEKPRRRRGRPPASDATTL